MKTIIVLTSNFLKHTVHSLFKNQRNWTLGLLFLKLSWFLECIVLLNLFLILHDFFLIFHNTVMIYNTRNRSNATIESQKEKRTCFNAHAGKMVNRINESCHCKVQLRQSVFQRNPLSVFSYAKRFRVQ